uniref:Galectin domain-containing protein n=1 Tax=Meloidogyne hapla TaxID=6305 RepID=A0A1I8BBR4_MELHA
MIFLITKECYEIYYDNEVIATYKHQIPVWAIQYIVKNNAIECNKRLYGEMSSTYVDCVGESECYFYLAPKREIGRAAEAWNEFFWPIQGCGGCTSNKIPCVACRDTVCNSPTFYNRYIFCRDKDNIVSCLNTETCYYAVINDTIVEQGCGPRTWKEENVQFIRCVRGICNTKEEFERVLFCLTKNKNDKEPKRMPCHEIVKMAEIYEEKTCFVHRDKDGLVEQGCGEKCPDNKESEFCKYCTTRNCNEEKLVSKYCFTNNGKIETKGDIPCFMERTKTNEVNKGFGQCPSSSLTCKTCNKNLCNDGTDLPYSYCLKFDGKRAIGCDKLDYSKAGCGTCDENNIEKSCFDCKGLNCNEKSKLEKAVFCYEREENGNEKEGSRPCNSKICFISVDINKGSGSSKETILKKYTKQGCGTCSSTKIPCRTCNKDLCNTEKYFQEVKFCWIKEYAVECDLNKWNGFCYYTLKKDKVEQGCGNGSKIEFDVLNVKCDQQLCNTKELFDKTLFCLNKGKDEKTNKAIICKENCKVERNYEGKGVEILNKNVETVQTIQIPQIVILVKEGFVMKKS